MKRTQEEALAQGAASILGRSLTSKEMESFDKYLKILLKWQRVERLVGSTDEMWIVEHLFLDSLLFLRVLPSAFGSVLDLGSGAGLPGLPIKIVKSEVELTLVESRRRRASFLSSAVRELGLDRTHVLEARVEDRLEELEGRFDVVVMRCAGNVGGLVPLGARIVRPHGVVVVAGPSRPRPLALGEWVTIPGLVPGRTRRFAVYLGRRSGHSGKC